MRAAELRALIALVDLISKPETQVALHTMRKRLADEYAKVTPTFAEGRPTRSGRDD